MHSFFQWIDIWSRIGRVSLLFFLGILTGCGLHEKTFLQRSSTMDPTIKAGQLVMVNHMAYIKEKPARWDAIMCRKRQGDTIQYFLTRIVGLPGETVQISESEILINGKLISKPPFLMHIKYGGANGAKFGVETAFLVPSDSCFVLGDNSRTAMDSRFLGAVALDMIVGKVTRIKTDADVKRIIVASKELTKGTVLKYDDLAKDRISANKLPTDPVLIEDLKDLIGKELIRDVKRGEPLSWSIVEESRN